MKVWATRIVEEPRTEMSTQAAVTGKAPSREAAGKSPSLRRAISRGRE